MKLCLLAASVLSAGLFIGCDNSDKPAAPATPSMGATSDKAKDAAADMKASAEAAGAKTGAMMDTAKAGAADVGNAVTDQAKKLYDQATAAVTGMKLDDAQKYFDQLKALRDKLPADWQTKVDELGKMITDAKAKMGAMPAVPGLPK